MISKLFIVTVCTIIFAIGCNGKQIDCSLVKCLAIECPEGQIPHKGTGQCCPTTCIPTLTKSDCSTVSCGLPLCKEGEVIETPPGECCPVCTRPDCAAVSCLAMEECDGEIVVPRGECCPRCQPRQDCSTRSCQKLMCQDGEVPETPPGECCPVCTRPDCAAVLCLALTEEDCEEGETLVTPPGQCCARCMQDCSVVACLRPVCEEGEVLEVPEGQCCPVCVKESCPIEGQVFSNCASPCPEACDSDPNIQCITLCVEGCTCPPGQVIDSVNNRCVEREKCPAPTECPIQGQVFSDCASACPATCDSDPNQVCILVCKQGCTCPPGQVIDTANNKCVERESCPTPNSCNIECPLGHRCTLDKATNQKFCNPDCKLYNGGCPAGQTCSLETVQCVQAPCPPVVSCSCPPDCSREYCLKNPNRFCSNPGPREIPGCTGSCQLAYCSACIFGLESPAVPTSTQDCRECPDYSTPSICYKRWSQCVGHQLLKANEGMISNSTSDAVLCVSPPCPLKG